MGALDGKIAIITGAGSGIGRASAFARSQDGFAGFLVDLGQRADFPPGAVDAMLEVDDRLFRHCLGKHDEGGASVR